MEKYHVGAAGLPVIKRRGQLILGEPRELSSPLSAYEVMVVVPGMLYKLGISKSLVSTIKIL